MEAGFSTRLDGFQSRLPCADEPELEPLVELPAIVLTTTGETGHGSSHATDARKGARAARTPIKQTAGACFNRKRQRVTTLLIGDAEIATGLSPLRPVR